MATLTQPNELARATLRQLATRRWLPTPDNYRKIYQELSGGTDAPAPDPRVAARLSALVMQTLELGVAARLPRAEALADETRDHARLLRAGPDIALIDELGARLKTLWPRLAAADREAERVQAGLLRLTRLLVDNAAELTPEEQWLKTQLTAVKDLLAGPLDAETIEAAHRKLRDAVYRQGLLRHGLDEVKGAFRQMVSKVINRTHDITATTGGFRDRLGVIAGKMDASRDAGEINALMHEAVRETNDMHASTRRTHDELLDARKQVEAAEARIVELEQQLERASAHAREDHLTGALNRRGLEEAFDSEAASSDRHGEAFSLAVLDLDNFKRLNDQHGHDAGDAALVHLADTVKQALRPFDRFARMGGEEFVILLPRTAPDDAADIIRRLQRALTRHFYLQDGRQLLITFSAGVTAFQPGELQDAAVARADKALYQAKQSGKNRVVIG